MSAIRSWLFIAFALSVATGCGRQEIAESKPVAQAKWAGHSIRMPRILDTPPPTTQPPLPATAFNTQNWPSDTVGTLPGTVIFAQNQTIPATPRVSGDVQPRLTAQRRTLVLFKIPPASLTPDRSVQLLASDANGASLGTISMRQPVDIPKQPGYMPGFNPALYDLGTAMVPTLSMATQAQLNIMADPGAEYLRSLLSFHARIEIQTFDGIWTRNIYLPGGVAAGRKIVVRGNAGYPTIVHYPMPSGMVGKATISRGTATAFVSSGNAWVSSLEAAESQYVYGHGFWSAVLPESWVKPGMTLAFTHAGLRGELNGIRIGPPSTLMLNLIDVGMLVTPRGAFEFANDLDAQREYFQTIPVARMVVNRYEPLYLPEVMMPNGRFLTGFARDQGGWHEGSMRQSIGKVLISHGINNANYGIHSSDDSENSPFLTAQLTAHNSRGAYANGVQVHGGSGGNGMVTLEDSIGNEFSHEVGHNYGLGHYVGADLSMHRPADRVNSAWAWDSDRNVFLPNFGKHITADALSCYTETNVCIPSFGGRHYGMDAMAGGDPMRLEANRFTFYSPYSMSFIQQFFEDKVQFDKASATGFSRWDEASRSMKPYAHTIVALVEAIVPLNTLATPAFGADTLASRFNEGVEAIRFSMRDGSWLQQVHFPPADAANSGKYIAYEHAAGFATTLRINGTNVSFTRGMRRTYRSTGTEWQEAPSYIIPRVPSQFEVPVTTILGYYDPQRQLTSYIYPALHGSMGYVYSQDQGLAQGDCRLTVTGATGGTLTFKLYPRRYLSGLMNKFHVNVPRAFNARSAEVSCAGQSLAQRVLEGPKQNLASSVYGIPL